MANKNRETAKDSKMRLTLRTLLAYIDHVLDPNDSRELANKIRESKLAQHTMERIDKGLANRSINPPAVNATDGVNDPNVLAEYLDNTLEPENVPQFERICFENDTQLIEAASVHRILTVALSAPTQVSPELMAKLKGLQSAGSASSPVKAPPVASSTEPATAQPVKNGQALRVDLIGWEPNSEPVTSFSNELSQRTLTNTPSSHGLDLSEHHTNAVPEYLRDRSKGVYLQYVLVASLLVGLCFVAWKIIGPLNQVKDLFEQSTVVVQQPENNKVPSETGTTPPATIVNDDAKANAANADSSIVESDVAPPAIATTDTTSLPSEQNDAPISSDNVAPPPVMTETNAQVAASTDVKAITEDSIKMDDVAPVSPASDGVIKVDDAAPIIADDVSPAPATSSNDEAAETSGAIVWQPETKESTTAIVMKLGKDAADVPSLNMVNIAETVPLASRVIVPDAYRTELRIAPGLKWTVASATDLQAVQGDTPKAAHVRLRLGRALVSATADCLTLVLSIGNEEYKLVMESPTTVASVEVRYFPRLGTRIEAVATELQANKEAKVSNAVLPVVTLGSVEGKVQVFVKRGVSWSPPEELATSTVLAFVDGERVRPRLIEEAPWWYRTSIERPIDAGAANDLALELQVPADTVPTPDPVAEEERPIDLFTTLSEATKVRRSETAALAARTLALVGRYDLVFGKDSILNQSNSRPHRALIIEAILQSLGIDQINCVKLTETLSEYDPPRGGRILGILSLPDSKALSGPEGSQPFLDALSSSFLDERAIAIHQLVKITGKEYTYQPDRVTSEALAQWRKIQTSGKINWSPASIKPLDWAE